MNDDYSGDYSDLMKREYDFTNIENVRVGQGKQTYILKCSCEAFNIIQEAVSRLNKHWNGAGVFMPQDCEVTDHAGNVSVMNEKLNQSLE